MASNHVHHHRTKHIKIDIHFVRERAVFSTIRPVLNLLILFTKGLPTTSFTNMRSSLNIVTPDVDTAGVLEICFRLILGYPNTKPKSVWYIYYISIVIPID